MPGLQVLALYEVYRALVRAMAAGLAPQGPQGTPAARLPGLRHAHGRADPAERAPDDHARLFGRGQIEHRVAAALRGRRRSRPLRTSSASASTGLDPLARSAEQGSPSTANRPPCRTFDRLWACAREALLAGYPVIVDAAFLRHAERLRFAALATNCACTFAILDCRADKDTLRRRVAARSVAGTGRLGSGPRGAGATVRIARARCKADEQRSAIEVATHGPIDIAWIEATWRA